MKAISYTEQRKLTGGEAMQAGWHWAGLATGAMAVETLLAAPAAALCRRRALPLPHSAAAAQCAAPQLVSAAAATAKQTAATTAPLSSTAAPPRHQCCHCCHHSHICQSSQVSPDKVDPRQKVTYSFQLFGGQF